MSKGIVICKLWKRQGKPSVNASKNGKYISGDEVEILDVVLGDTDNDYYEGTPTWYKLAGDIYIWSGGVSMGLSDSIFIRKLLYDKQIKESEITLPSSDTNTSSGIIESINSLPQILLKANPKLIFDENSTESITIAVLDSGIDNRFNGFSSRIGLTENYQDDTGFNPHGTNLAGLIIGNDAKVNGLCTMSRLFDMRVIQDDKFTSDIALVRALKDIKDNKLNDVEIINMSLDIGTNHKSEIQGLINALSQQGIVCVVAGTFGTGLTTIGKLQNVVAVGTFARYQFDDLKEKGYHKELATYFWDTDILTTDRYPNHNLFGDSSAYTGVVSGILANMLSIKKPPKSDRFAKSIEYLKENSLPLAGVSNKSKLEPFTLYKNAHN